MQQITLTGLLGTRESADDELARAVLPADLGGVGVVLYCRDLISGSPSFADQLVKVLVQDRHADEVVLVGAPERFTKHMTEAAKRRGVTDAVRAGTAASVGA